MGNTRSSSARPPLHEDDAFALATHLRDHLRDFVTLTTHAQYDLQPTESDDPEPLGVCHFEWVTFGATDASRDLLESLESSVAAARASAIVWLAISNCAGYSGKENPRFWKRVFSALVAGGERREIADEVRFFEHADRPFPCVRLQPRPHEEETMLRVFFKGTKSSDHGLRRVIRRVRRHIVDRKWWKKRKIDLEIVEMGLARLASLGSDWEFPMLQRVPRRMPSFRVVAFRSPRNYQLLTASAYRIMTSTLAGVAVYVPYCHVEPESTEPSVFRIAYERRRASKNVHIGTIRPRQSTPGNHVAFAAMCSMIPHSRLATRIELMGGDDDIDMDDTDGAWLGYALFHPDAGIRSSLTALSISQPSFRSSTMNSTTWMSAGNNLLLLTENEPNISYKYYSGRLAANTNIHARNHPDSQVVYTVSCEERVTLCIRTRDELVRDAWISVVVPGVGLRWVRGSRISKVISRPPSTAALRRLELFQRGALGNVLDRVTASYIFRHFGASLTHLTIEAELPTQALPATLQHCPHLQALRVHYNGLCWSDPSLIEETPSLASLRTIELTISDRMYPLVAPQLSGLTCLRVIDVNPEHKMFAIHRDSLLETLRRCPRLLRVFWSSTHCNPLPWWESTGYRPWWKPTELSDQRDWQSTSHHVVGQDVHGALAYVRYPLPSFARIAFLSVFSSRAETPLPRLPLEIIQHVLAFSSMFVPRQLLIRQVDETP